MLQKYFPQILICVKYICNIIFYFYVRNIQFYRLILHRSSQDYKMHILLLFLLNVTRIICYKGLIQTYYTMNQRVACFCV